MPRAAAFATALALVCAGAALSAEGPYPVKLNPRLGLESADTAAIDARLGGPLWPDWPEGWGLDLYKFSRDPWFSGNTPFEDLVIDQALATNCIELKALTEAGYLGRYRNDRGVQQGLLKECEAIEMLRRVRPARISYVRDFVMSANAVDVLPVMLDQPFGRQLCDEYAANQQGVPWSAFYRSVEVDVRDDYTIEVMAETQGPKMDDPMMISLGDQTWVKVMAWGDFNEDGVEDLLLLSRSTSVEWHGPERKPFFARTTWDEMYVVTRDAPGAVMRVINEERYLTPERLRSYSCSSP